MPNKKGSYLITYHKGGHFLTPDIQDYSWIADKSSMVFANVDFFSVPDESEDLPVTIVNSSNALLTLFIDKSNSISSGVSIKIGSTDSVAIDLKPDLILSEGVSEAFITNNTGTTRVIYVVTLVQSGLVQTISNVLSLDIISRFLDLKDTFTSYDGREGQFLVVQNGAIASIDFPSLPSYLDDNDIYQCNTNVSLGDAVYMDNTGVLQRSSKNNVASIPIIGIVRQKVTNSTAKLQVIGLADFYSGLSINKLYYLGYNGSVTISPASIIGEVLYPLGIARTSTALELRLDNSFVIL